MKLLLIAFSLILPLSVHAATDAYQAWAVAKWGVSIVGNSAARLSTWGESADPDHDGLPNLLEYATDTNPQVHNPSSDCSVFAIPDAGTPASRYPQLTAFIRQDDPDLRVIPQTSSDLFLWEPFSPVDFTQPQPVNTVVLIQGTGLKQRGLHQMRYVDKQSMAQRSRAFMRLKIVRRNESVTTPPIEPFFFTPGQTVATGGTARSNAITLGGFAGATSVTIPAGATLYINGVAQTGTTATVKAGDVLWLQATAPATAGLLRNHTLTIAGHSSTWRYTTGTVPSVPDHPGTDSGYTPVETGVSDTGAAQISIPIVVSPGTAGMQPKLSINYSSHGGDGPLGIGFGINGLSTISRVGRTIAHDGMRGGISFDENDRYALDGQRLIAINGADGGEGTEYRLEFDPSSRIRSYDNNGRGPQRWVVETKAGLTMEFGLRPASRALPEGSLSALAWSVDRIADTMGNEIHFYYDSGGVGEVVIDRIEYTSNSVAGTSANQQVVFEYGTRPDIREVYVGGHRIRSQRRLEAIESRARDNAQLPSRVCRYDLTYGVSPTSKRSRVTNIAETNHAGTTRHTQFDWGTSENAVDVLPAVQTAMAGSSEHPEVLADFDGDGRTDVLTWNWPTSNGGYNMYLATANLTPDGNGVVFKNAVLTNIKPASGESPPSLLPADYNGDGKTDLLQWNEPLNNQRYNLRLSTGNGFQTAVATSISSEGSTTRPDIPGDFNGDGRADILVWNKPFNNQRYNLYLANASGFSPALATDVRAWNGTATENVLPGDYNGDGLLDLMVWHEPFLNNRYNLHLGTGTGFQPATTTSVQTYGNSSLRDLSVDVNGDGLSDILTWHEPLKNNFFNLHLSKGNGTFAPAIPTLLSPHENWRLNSKLTMDLNGDGVLDILSWHNPFGNYRYNAHLGNRTAFDAAIACNIDTWDNPGIINKSGDFNGDGRTDLLVWHAPFNNFRNNIYFSKEATLDLIRGVTTGHGGNTQFSYKPLTNASVHTPGNIGSYPSHSFQASIYVVDSITTRNGVDGDAFSAGGPASPGTNTISYHYTGAWTSLDGRGFMGFNGIQITDAASGIVTSTSYDMRPLCAGRPTYTSQWLLPGRTPPGGSSVISTNEVIWYVAETTHPTGRKTYMVTEGWSLSHNYEVNRAEDEPIKTVFRYGPLPSGPVPSPSPPFFGIWFSSFPIAHDAHGNLLECNTITSTTIGSSDAFYEKVMNTYVDVMTPSKWHLGRLSTSTVTKSGPNPTGTGNSSLSRSSAFAYDLATGLLKQEVVEPDGGILRQQKDYTHDAFGNILTSTVTVLGESPRTTSTTYTADGRFVETTTNAVGHTESKTYDPLLGNVLTQTGPNGLTTTWEYDFIGRPVKETRPDGIVTRSFYRRVAGGTVGAPPRAVHYVRAQSSGGPPKTVWYDLLDREIRTDSVGFDGSTVSAHKVFNHLGQITHASQPYLAGTTPLYTTLLYDAVGREQSQTDPGNRVTQTMYNGLNTSVTNPKGQTVGTAVNAMGWTVQSTQDSNKSVYRKYDPYGNLRFVSDSSGGGANLTEIRYDVRGNKVWMSEPNSGVSTYTYNGFGEIKSQTNSAGETISFTRDVLGRVTSRMEPEGLTTFTYDTAEKGKGQLEREVGPGFERLYFYDLLGRPAATQETHGFHNFSTSRGYDLVGRPDTLTYPTGFATQQVYTANGHLSEVRNATNPSEIYWRALLVNARGQVTREALGNGVVTDRAFEAETGLIQDITSTFGSTGDVQKLSFGFDVIGNLTERKDKRYSTHFVEGFGYDALNRLQNVTTTGAGNVTATYDAIGNITHRSDVGSFSYSSGKPHALTAISGGTQAKTCDHDTKGNRTIDGDTRLEYSSFNKPVRIRKTDDSSILGFDYGTDRGLSRQTIFQISPLTGTSQTIREYVGAYEREMTSEGIVRHIHHIAGGSGVVAIHTDERSATSQSQRTRYVHKDHLGSVDAITDDSGAVVERQSYDAWGRRRNVTHNSGTWAVSYPSKPGSAETRRGFTGHEMLDLVGLIHMGGRIYDPLTSRFLSPDPFVQSPDNQQNLNRYSYVLNNPLSHTDPSGFFFKKFFKSVLKLFVQHVVGSFTGVVGAAIGFAVAGPSGAAWGFRIGYGFGSAFSGTLLAGGSASEALRAGMYGGLSAGVANGVGSAFSSPGLERYAALKPVVHGATQGGIRAAQGGKFSHSFMSAAFASQFEGIADMATDAAGSVWAGRAVSAVVGGTSEAIGGGKFGNGAMTGAFIRMFNDEEHLEWPRRKTVLTTADGEFAGLQDQLRTEIFGPLNRSEANYFNDQLILDAQKVAMASAVINILGARGGRVGHASDILNEGIDSSMDGYWAASRPYSPGDIVVRTTTYRYEINRGSDGLPQLQPGRTQEQIFKPGSSGYSKWLK